MDMEPRDAGPVASLPVTDDPPEAVVAGLPAVRLGGAALADLELLAVGAYFPLRGFVSARDHAAVVETACLEDKSPFGLPIALAASAPEAAAASRRGACALVGEDGRVYGRLDEVEAYTVAPAPTAAALYGTCDPAHPGVARFLAQGPIRLSGRVTLLRRPPLPQRPAVLDPAEVRRLAGERGWRTVVAFQTRNPVHRAHEYIQKVALELVDGLLLHPLVGETREEDLPDGARMRAYRALLDHYYPPGRVLLAAYPAAMRYAGPREALLHARARRNYGCTHFIVGRDHAGVGGYYAPDAAQRLVAAHADRLGIAVLAFSPAFYCRRCDQMATERTCPHPAGDRLALSGTEVRRRLRAGEALPPEFTRPEVAVALAEALAASAPASR
jgi:sulfate adenylyltransferase